MRVHVYLCGAIACAVTLAAAADADPARAQRLVSEPGLGGAVSRAVALPIHEGRVEGAAGMDRTPGGLAIRREHGPATWSLPVQGDVAAYRMLRLKAALERGGKLVYGWEGRLREQPVMPGGPHEYVLPLAAPESAGEGARLVVEGRGEPGMMVLEKAELVAPRTGRGQVTLDYVTQPGYRGVPEPWTVQAVEGGVFSVRMAVDPALWATGGAEKARFTVTVGDDELAAWTARPDGPQSQYAEASLSDYAGREVTLTFRVEGVGPDERYFAFWGAPLVRSGGAGSPPVILISCDTLRADHLSCYGYERITTPHFDALAEDGVLFENGVSEDPWTLPAHMTMLTGLHPATHRVGRGAEALALDQATLTSILADRGYVTGGFTGHGPILYPRHGFARGFDIYSTPQTFRDVTEVMAASAEWTAAHADHPFFLFHHNYDIHSKFPDVTALPYYPHDERYLVFSPPYAFEGAFRREDEPFLPASAFLVAVNQGRVQPPTKEEREYMIALYDDAILGVDAELGAFFERLRESGRYDRALIILTSDHGEAFGEHGLYIHDDLYEQCARVPLIIKLPGGRHAGTRVETVAALADIAPTVLDALGVRVPDEMDGVSLLPAIEGKAPREWVHISRKHWESARTTEWKLILDTRTQERELYHVAEDPQEQRNLADEEPAALEQLSEKLATVYQPADRSGWHVRFQQPAGAQEPRGVGFAAQADEPFESAVVDGADQHDAIQGAKEGRLVQGMSGMPPGDWDELLLKPRPLDAPVQLTLQCPQPAEVRLGGASFVAEGQWRRELLPAAGRGSEPAELNPPAGERVVVTIWFEEGPAEALPTQGMSPEEREHLRALGYLE